MGERLSTEQRNLCAAVLPHASQRHALRQPQLSRLSVAATGLRLAPQLRPGFQFESHPAPAELRQLQTRHHAAPLHRRLHAETAVWSIPTIPALNSESSGLVDALPRGARVSSVNGLRANMKHSFSVYDFKSNFLGSSTGEDLFHVICSGERIIVDNCEWKKRSLAQPQLAFILGKTIVDERNNLHGELFNEKIRGGRSNVFLFGVEKIKDCSIGLVIHRLDAHLPEIFSGPIPPRSGPNAGDPNKWNCPIKRERLRDSVKNLMNDSSERLHGYVASNVQACFRNFDQSCLVADYCHALALLEIRQQSHRERQKFSNNASNLFGDTALIQNALFLGAKILSGDRAFLKQMADYCSIQLVA